MERLLEFSDRVTDWARSGYENNQRHDISGLENRRFVIGVLWALIGLGVVVFHAFAGGEFLGAAGMLMLAAGVGYLVIALLGMVFRNW